MQGAIFVRFCIIVDLLAGFVIGIGELIEDENKTRVIIGTLHAFVASMLLLISYKVPHSNCYLGYLFMISFYINALGLGLERYADLVAEYVLALLIGNLYTIAVDRSLAISAIANSLLGVLYWYHYRDVAGDDVQLMYRLPMQVGLFMFFVGWWFQYLKRRIFFQAHSMEQQSKRWLSFLNAHPDPITIFSEERELLFRNEDCIKIFTPEIDDGDNQSLE